MPLVPTFSIKVVYVFRSVFRMLKMIICHEWIKTMAKMMMTTDPPISRRTNWLGNVRMIQMMRKTANSSKTRFIRKMMKFTFDRITKFQLVDKCVYTMRYTLIVYVHYTFLPTILSFNIQNCGTRRMKFPKKFNRESHNKCCFLSRLNFKTVFSVVFIILAESIDWSKWCIFL